MIERLSLIVLLFVSISHLGLAAQEPKVLFEQDATQLTTSVNLVITTGAADDSPLKAGLSDMLGQMMLRGTKKRNRSKFQIELEHMGAAIGVHVSHDTIEFDGRVIKENTYPFLKLIEDFLLHPAFSQKEFSSLKTEMLANIDARKNQNSRLVGLAVRKQVFANTPMERPVDGGTSTISRITIGDLQKSYNDRIHRGNLIFAVVSPLPEAEIKKTIQEMWVQLPDGLKLTHRSIPLQVPKQPVVTVIQKSETSTGAFMFGQEGITAQDKDRYTLSAADFSFGSEALVSRLFRVIRGELGWTYAIGSSYGAIGELTYQQGLYIISATPSVEYTGKAILKTLSMWREYLKNGLRPDELTLAKESLVNSYPFEFDTAEKRLGRQLHSYLYNVPILSTAEYAKTIDSVTNDDIKKALQQKHKPDSWVITVIADSKLIEKQLEAEQKEIPESQRLKVTRVLQPEDLIN